MIRLWFNEQFNVHFWFTDSLKEMEVKVCEDYHDYEVHGANGKMISWVVGEKQHQRKNIAILAISPATLAHECVHATHEICDWTGQKPDIENDEFFCYLVENIFRQYCKRIKPNWNKEAWRQ